MKAGSERQLVQVKIPDECVGMAFCRNCQMPKVVGLPEDAEFVRATHEWASECFIFIFRHRSFQVVLEGAQPPSLDTFEWKTRPSDWLGTYGSTA
jgi:hypothetical protein